MTDEGCAAGQGLNEERELAGYLEELISAALASKAPGRPADLWETDEPEPVELVVEAPNVVATPDTPRTGEEPVSPGRGSPPSSRPAPRTSRASMSEELAALFRPTDRSSFLPSPPTAVHPQAPEIEPGLPATEPSTYLKRFMQLASRPHQATPSGLADLDHRLAGGFGAGLHLLLGQPGVERTAFLDSLAWEAVTSERPVVYYSLLQRSLGAWERLVSTLGSILGDSTISPASLRTRRLDPDELRTLTRLDLALQNSVLPFLSLVDAIPANTDPVSAFIDDVRSRAREAEERHGGSPLLLVDDLERLLLLTGARAQGPVLLRLEDTLIADSLTGLVATIQPDRSPHGLGGLPAQTTLVLMQAPGSADYVFERVDLEVLTNARTGWTGTLPLILDRRSGLLNQCPLGPEREATSPQ